ncbi:ABC transporter permease [Agrobacterium vitis]|uniref:ABC transporter permease n=1 Tax=Agrobacterium vitis TaxID=373 RepID=UPI0015DA8CAC|nr:ABC transporter permease [Agrobacterium vitis]MCF1452207.1 ABC transporter permease [Agrobacterium vitis]BCH55918.1 ribose ABC transporter permease [Agrobacterium vitis]
MTLKHFLRHETILAVAAVLLLTLLAFQSSQFFTTGNLLNQGRQMTEVGLVAIVMTFVIITGGIDLSVGSILGLTAILTGVFWQNLGLPLAAAAGLAIVAGTFCGFLNGFVITRFGVPPLITTLATLALYRGLAEGISQARSVRGYPDWFYVLGQGNVLGVPTQLWFLVAFAFVATVLLAATRIGRSIYAIGANEVAAFFSGLPVNRTKIAVYTCSGFAAALAGVIFVSRVSTTRSDMGTGLELDAITAVVLGGTSIYGGRGSVIGTLIGLVVIQSLKNGLSLAGVKTEGTAMLIGLMLIGAILMTTALNRRRV